MTETEPGRVEKRSVKGQIKSQLRRTVGVHVARANADVGINRLKYIGTGGAMALARRNGRLAQRRAEEEV